MAGLRASDHDRDRTLELIEAAYVDGRLTSAERETRTGQALSAVTRPELDGLVSDLDSGNPAQASTAVIRVWALAITRRAVLIPTAIAVLVGAIATVSIMTIRPASAPEINSVLTAPKQQSPGSYLTVDGFHAMVDAVRAKFGTTQIGAAIVDPGYAVFAIVRADDVRKVDLWNYRGSFTDGAKTATLGADEVLVDLSLVSTPALVDLMAAGEAAAGTAPIDQSYVRFSGATGVATMTARVTDVGGQTHELVRDFDGKPLPKP